jgi:hypothetical protein
MDATEHDYVVSWDKWRAYRWKNWDIFETIDAQILAEHVQTAESWDSA